MGLFSRKKPLNVLVIVLLVLIAEFGVFSSVTVTARRPAVGAAFYVLFHIAAGLYVYLTRKDRRRALIQFAIVSVAAFCVSLLFYYTWELKPLPLAKLFPLRYFTESTMVAAVTGVGFSLVLSGRE